MKIPQITIRKDKVDYNKKLNNLYHRGLMNKDKYNEIKNSANQKEGLKEYYYFISGKQVIISLVLFFLIIAFTVFMLTTVRQSILNADEYNEICEVSSEYTEGIDCNKSFATDSDIKTLKTLISNEIEMPLSNSDYEKKIDDTKNNYKTVIGYDEETINKKYSSSKVDNMEDFYNSFNKHYNADLKAEQSKLDELVSEADGLDLDVALSKDDTLVEKQNKYSSSIKTEEKRIAEEKKAKEEAEAKAKEEAEANAKEEATEQSNTTASSNTTTNTSSNETTPVEEEAPEVNNDYCYPTYDDGYEAGLNVFLNGSFIESYGIGKFEVNSNNCPIYYGTDGTYDINGNKI